MMLSMPLPPRAWLAQLESSRHRLALLTGSCDVPALLKDIRRILPGCVAINVSLALSQRLLGVALPHRQIQSPSILADVLAGEEPALLYDLELLFELALQLDPLRVMRAASRSRLLLALWPGTLEDGNLTYAEPDHPQHRQYRPDDLEGLLVAPAADLTKEA